MGSLGAIAGLTDGLYTTHLTARQNKLPTPRVIIFNAWQLESPQPIMALTQ